MRSEMTIKEFLYFLLNPIPALENKSIIECINEDRDFINEAESIIYRTWGTDIKVKLIGA